MPRIPAPLIFLAVVAAASWPIALLSGMTYPITALIVAGAILVNGLIAVIEDDLPGGFNNADGASTPRYVLVLSRTSGLRYSACTLLLMDSSCFSL